MRKREDEIEARETGLNRQHVGDSASRRVQPGDAAASLVGLLGGTGCNFAKARDWVGAACSVEPARNGQQSVTVFNVALCNTLHATLCGTRNP